MITEYSKPWNYDKVWFDHETKYVVVKLKNGSILKWMSYCTVDVRPATGGDDPFIIDIYNPDGEYLSGEDESAIIEIDDRCNGDFITGLRKAFENLKREQYPYLCPDCEYGHFFRSVKSAEGIPYDMQYICIDKSKKRELSPEMIEHNKKMEKLINTPYPTIVSPHPGILDYENGPGGWDGAKCPNFKKREKNDDCNWTMTVSNIHT